MRAIIQRVTEAQVTVNKDTIASIKHGALVLVGITHTDTPNDCDWMAEKLLGLRFFADDEHKMNHDIISVQGALLVVSQFTLYAECKKGKRPSYSEAATSEKAEPLFNTLISRLREKYPHIHTGQFGANMQVSLVNDGPVTLILESPISHPHYAIH